MRPGPLELAEAVANPSLGSRAVSDPGMVSSRGHPSECRAEGVWVMPGSVFGAPRLSPWSFLQELRIRTVEYGQCTLTRESSLKRQTARGRHSKRKVSSLVKWLGCDTGRAPQHDEKVVTSRQTHRLAAERLEDLKEKSAPSDMTGLLLLTVFERPHGGTTRAIHGQQRDCFEDSKGQACRVVIGQRPIVGSMISVLGGIAVVAMFSARLRAALGSGHSRDGRIT